MKNFTDELVNVIIEHEKKRLDGVLNEVSKQISIDFATHMFMLLDEYYDNYDPHRYVRVYGKKGKYLQGKTPARGQESLHAAVTRGGAENADLSKNIDKHYRDNQISYVGGIEFDPDYFKDADNHMRHTTRMSKDADGNKVARISEWNIIENFLYAGEGITSYGEPLKGDWRSVSKAGYNYPSADEAMKIYMDFYYETFIKHYNRALSGAIRKI